MVSSLSDWEILWTLHYANSIKQYLLKYVPNGQFEQLVKYLYGMFSCYLAERQDTSLILVQKTCKEKESELVHDYIHRKAYVTSEDLDRYLTVKLLLVLALQITWEPMMTYGMFLIYNTKIATN